MVQLERSAKIAPKVEAEPPRSSRGRGDEMNQRPRDFQEKPKVKTLLIATCACLVFAAGAWSVFGQGKDELHIGVWLTTGERSRDSGSKTTTITVERKTIVWEQSSSRDRRRGTPPKRKEFKLSPADKQNLLKVIRSNNLLVTDSIELPEEGSNYRYFRISAELALGRKKGTIKISARRTAVEVKEEKLYQNTLTLVKELFRIINSQDKDVGFEELVHER